MIWTYIGVGLTIFFGGLGVGIVVGMWIGKMMSAQEQHGKAIENLTNELRDMRLLQGIMVDRETVGPARRRSAELSDILTRRPSEED